MRKNHLVPSVLAIGAITLSLLGGSTYAYLTDRDTADNRMTIGQVTIDLEEPHFKPEENRTLTPGSQVSKDPQIKNTGNTDAFVYLDVAVPMASVVTADASGARKPKAEMELFHFSPSEDWALLERRQEGAAAHYSYAYKKILKSSETTTPLFSSMTLVNLIEGQLDNTELLVPIQAYAIQSAHTGDGKESVLEQATAAYSKYLKQNSAAKPTDAAD